MSPMMEEILNRVEHLSDLDLRKELSARNFSCGPIVGTTRNVYKKKLVDMLLDEEIPAEARAARAAPSSEEEEEDVEVAPESQYVNGGRKVNPYDEPPAANLYEEEEEEEEEEQEEERKDDARDSPSQEESEEEDTNEEHEEESQEDAEDEDHGSIVRQNGTDVLRHRVPGHGDSFETKTSVAIVSEDGKTVKRTTTTTTRVVKASDLAATATAPLAATKTEKPKRSSCLSILLQLIVIAIIVFFVYVIVMGPSTPLGIPSKPHDVENPPLEDGAV